MGTTIEPDNQDPSSITPSVSARRRRPIDSGQTAQLYGADDIPILLSLPDLSTTVTIAILAWGLRTREW